MESSLAASKKCFLKSSARLRTAVQVMQRAGFYSVPSEGPIGAKQHFRGLRKPRLCRGHG
ncbi:MAG: hypothetical protein DBY17_07845 [Oscillospiraceae bacterium]|nr:MAG: hypothetical protein DBY17_07845 [Oscillospiraceae bacterium]